MPCPYGLAIAEGTHCLVTTMNNRTVLMALLVIAAILIAGRAQAQIRITVDASEVVAEVSPLVFGTNFNPKMESDEKIVKLLDRLGLTVFRYPGGAGNFDWRRGWAYRTSAGGPVRYRTRPEPLADFDRMMDFADSVGVQLVVELNVGTGSAQSAAEFVRHTNVERGFKITHWDLGNEVWLSNWDGAQDYASYHGNPSEYAALLASYSAAMKAVDPTVKLGMGTGGSYYDASSNWDRVVIGAAADAIDYISLHWYPNHTGPNHKSPVDGVSVHPDPYVLMANSLQIPALARRYREMIGDLAPHRAGKIELAFTEWEGSWDTTNHDYDLYMGMWSLANGLLYADAIGQFIRHGVTLACHYDFQSNNFGLIRGWEPTLSLANGWELNTWDEKTIRPKALALELWRNHFGQRMVACQVAGSPEYTKPQGAWDWPDAYSGRVPYVTAWAGKSADRSRLHLILINRHHAQACDADISLAGFTPRPTGRTFTLSGPSLRAMNDGYPGTVAIAESALEGVSRSFVYRIPPRSATAIELEREIEDGSCLDREGNEVLGLFGDDATVGFDDFLIFVKAFGKVEGDTGYNSAYDIEPDGRIDFADFLVFAGNFGRTAVNYTPPPAS